jgi:hypothetical protein
VSTLSVATSYPADWSDDVPLLASRRWLRAMAGRIEGQPLWLSTRTGRHTDVGLAGYLVADPAAYAFGNLAELTASPSSPFAPPAVSQALAATRPAADTLFPHLLLTWPGYASFPVGGRRDEPSAVRDALCQVVRWAAGERIAAVAVPYASADGILAVEARRLGFRRVPLAQDATLPVPAGGFPAYLAGLSGRRRRRVSAERRAWYARGQRAWLAAAVTPAMADRMAQLRAAQRARYGLAADPAAERARIATVLDLLGDAVDVFTIGERPAEMVCFSLFVRDGTTWHALYFGADGDDERARGGYFEAVFYRPVEVGADLGITEISFGLGSSEAKLLRGCRMTQIDCLLTATGERARQTVARIERAWRPTGARGDVARCDKESDDC